jgi:ABC-2 type transport system ATP-binding protein
VNALLELDGVRKVYKSDLFKKQQVAVDDLSFTFTAGGCIGLIGPNGAGKTTTLRLILGLIRPDAGRVLFEGRPLDTKARRGIGYMPEVNKLPGALTVEEILRHQLRITRGCAPAATVDAKLAQVGLGEHRKKRLKQLSKGMARRVAWAQATIHEPRFLILDEPASGLDPVGRRDQLAWIDAEKQRGATILLCTHELAQVRTLCDDLLILNRGRTVLSTLGKSGTPEALVWPWAYDIHVSGDGEDGLRRVGEQRRLPPWQGFRQKGFLAVLGFAEYAPAAAWLTALIQSERAVLRFGEHTGIPDDELLSYFEASKP